MLRKLYTAVAFCFLLISFLMVGPPQYASAATSEYCDPAGDSSIPFLPKWYKYLDTEFVEGQGVGGEGSCNVQFNWREDIPAILLAVFEILLRVVGLISVIFVIYGGFQYLITTGEPEKAKNARTTIINALVGMIVAMLATVIVNLIAGSIT